MKKVSIILSLFLLAATGSLFAQSYKLENVLISSAKLSDGKNTVRLPDGKGSIELVKRGDKFSDVVFTDAAGKSTRLAPAPAGTGGVPKPACKFPLPDACFGTPNAGQMGMCICKPTEVSNGGDYTVSLLLPAVQKVREAANKSN
jgi:hypothetical protein